MRARPQETLPSVHRRSEAHSLPREYHPIAPVYDVPTIRNIQHDKGRDMRVPEFVRVFSPYFWQAIQQSNRDKHQITFRHSVTIKSQPLPSECYTEILSIRT